ncbi:unnamed protein product [Closterium sp. NIES-65]|nr:unnamed protein product [Closterium sp. NIES-65]
MSNASIVIACMRAASAAIWGLNGQPRLLCAHARPASTLTSLPVSPSPPNPLIIAKRAASAAIWGVTLACYAAMLALPRRLSGYVVFLAAFAFLIFWSAPSHAPHLRPFCVSLMVSLLCCASCPAFPSCPTAFVFLSWFHSSAAPHALLFPLVPLHFHATSLDASAWRRGDIDFTGTLMIVTLKLVGAAMDCQDGSMGQQDGRERQDGREKQDGGPPRASSASPSARSRVPPLVPFLGFVFFPAALLVGPPFPLAAYHDYVEGRGCWATLYAHKHPSAPHSPAFPPRVLPACAALLKALLCMAVYHTLSHLLPPAALTQPAFFARPFLIRCGQVALTLLAYRWMFYFIWAVAESALILSAFGFSGFKAAAPSHREGDGEAREGEGGQKQQRLEADWSRASNVNIWVVEVTGSAAQLPSNWNIGVSNWLRTYVYDRMTPPSGKPNLTTLLVTQAVSALWHGLHPGYYLFFLSAAIAQDASKLLHRLHQSIPPHRRWQRGMAWVAQMLYTRVLVGYAPLGFIVSTAIPCAGMLYTHMWRAWEWRG